MSPQERFFEDYEVGAIHDCGSIGLSEDEIIEFARRFDPQPMHTDPELARQGRFGGLIASGWHTAALAMRLYVDRYLPAQASLASPGVDELRWPNPVRPGDTLSVRVTILEATPSTRRDDRGMVRGRLEMTNQHGNLVLTAIMNSIIGRRPTAGAG
jgi:acyl dehydratase